MPASIDAVLDACVADGLDLQALAEAALARVAPEACPPTLAPGLDPGQTLAELEERETAPETAVTLPGAPVVPPEAPRLPGLSRYDDLGPLGEGGMGAVRRVRDRRLGRTLALKTIHAPALVRPELVARFLEEAQATAQLEHPGIVPIHDLGELPDGRLWFTMKEVAGRTLTEVLAEVHAVSRRRWRVASSGWSLRRLVDALRQVSEAVGYAHSRGVVHRDLKPDNVMVGAHGEVLVVDWGLAKVLGRPDAPMGGLGSTRPTPVQTDRSTADAHRTQVGLVTGTPAYMPPEQAQGQVEAIDARSDVYALGAMLYEVLSGRPPYEGDRAWDVVAAVRAGPPPPLRVAGSAWASSGDVGHQGTQAALSGGPPLPAALVAVCERAMARDPADRFRSAAELASALQAWLDGMERREAARRVVAEAAAKVPEAEALRRRAVALRAEAALLLAGVAPWQPESDKAPGWAKEDEAVSLERQAELRELEEEQLLLGSLTHAPDLPEAHAALAARYRAEHAAAEAVREDASRPEARLRLHLGSLPEDHAERADHLAYLQGDGALTLVTDPPGAEVLLYRYRLHNRRLVPRLETHLGTTPLQAVSVPCGSYLCLLRHPDREEVRYPVSIGRGEHWDGVPPEGGDPRPLPLPRLGSLGPEDCWVPGGWFACGGDPHQERGLSARRIWVDGHVFRRFPVTNREFLAFLDALVADGRTEEALRHAPQERAAAEGEQGALFYGFDGQRFSLRPDAQGDLWLPDWPVCMVDWDGAAAFAAWEAARTGQPWRLPGERAWEKAARGVDGRFYPWGDGFDPSWACMVQSHRDRILPAPVGAFPVDESPYGVRDLAGGMQEWCGDAFVDTAVSPAAAPAATGAHLRAIRGGSFGDAPSLLRAVFRYGQEPAARSSDLSFRLARTLG